MISGSRGVSRYLKYALLAIVGAALLALFICIYVTRAFTWADVYSYFGLAAPAQGTVDAPEGEQKLEIIEGELEGETAEVCFLAVGQGDCAVIRAGGMTAVIDAGEVDSAEHISGYLKANAITSVDYLFFTHPHADHIGSASVILNSCEVKKCVMTHFDEALTPTSYGYLALLKQMLALETPMWLAGDGEVYELGGGKITVLLAGNFENLNDCSLIMRFDYGERSFLLMGDAGFEPEQHLLSSGANISADVIKIGHHGSRYSTSGAFLAAVNPKYAAITCGAGNQYGYPSKDVLNLLAKQEVTPLCTDSGRDLLFKTDGKLINVYQ